MISPVPRFYWILFLAAILVLQSSTYASPEAWQALQNLDIVKAKELFQQELKNSPKDVSLMRGLLLAAYFDLDVPTQARMAEQLAETDPSNPYLMAIFEHVAAHLDDWSKKLDVEKKIGDALANHAAGAAAYYGRCIEESYYGEAEYKLPKNWFESMGYAPGAWIIGPFDNKGNIAAYRPVPFEEEMLDTLAIALGRSGIRTGWTWLEHENLGNIWPLSAMYHVDEMACQARIFFDLPQDMEVNILWGGIFSLRLALDGQSVYHDPTFRNARQREGVRAQLRSGLHEVTLTLGTPGPEIDFRLKILDRDFRPIKGIKWPRYSARPDGKKLSAQRIHPIFDPLAEYVAAHGTEQDTRFWEATLKTFNGYANEVVQELERSLQDGGLSQMDKWALCVAQKENKEKTKGNETLNQIKEKVATPLVEATWIQSTSEQKEDRLRGLAILQQKYPDRILIDFLLALGPLSHKNPEASIAELKKVQEKYSWSTAVPYALSEIYKKILHDPAAAFQEYKAYCDLTKSKRTFKQNVWSYHYRMGKYDEAIADTWEVLRAYLLNDHQLANLVTLYRIENRAGELIFMLDSLKTKYPYNLEIHDMLDDIYKSTSQFDKLRQIYQEIHFIQPLAVQPYLHLDSLHHFVSYDSLFGSVDIDTLWNVVPTERELAGKNYWTLLDRQQILVFETGMTCKDSHVIQVLLDQDAVKNQQVIKLGFDPKENRDIHSLLVARRLRKGQTPLAGTVNEQQVAFKDLKPGDAIELHIREWKGRSGDLWQEFWDTYLAGSSNYRRYWEYTILTNREDLQYVSFPPAPEPMVGEGCGFKMICWKGEKVPGTRLDMVFLPPKMDLMGEIFVSTLKEWETINRWYGSISNAILGDNPRCKNLADQLTAHSASPQAKLAELYKYVVTNIPYQVVDFDYDAAIPHTPDEVLVNRWGDCKDKGHLLVQMLRQVNIEAWPVLVKIRAKGTRLPLPMFDFNHLIVGCKLDGDTLFVDPTDVPYAPERSLNYQVSGQPCLNVGSPQPTHLNYLPKPQWNDFYFKVKLSLKLQPGGECSYLYDRQIYNLAAGFMRDDYLGRSLTDYKKDLESRMANQWSVTLTIDSLQADSVECLDSVFTEVWRGSMRLNQQSVGDMTLVTPPDFSFLSKSMVTDLETKEQQTFPTDLRFVADVQDLVMELEVPASYGRPVLPNSVHLQDSLYRFDFSPTWDPATRKLTLAYYRQIQDGLCDRQKFTAFAKQIIETCNHELVFKKE